jgi:hypothetical protein
MDVKPALLQSTVFLPPDHLQVHLGSPGHVSAALADDTSKNNSILIKKTNMVRLLLVQTPKALCTLVEDLLGRNSLELVGFMANWLLIVVRA